MAEPVSPVRQGVILPGFAPVSVLPFRRLGLGPTFGFPVAVVLRAITR